MKPALFARAAFVASMPVLGIAFFLLFLGSECSGQVMYGSTLSQIKKIGLGTCQDTFIVACPPLNDMAIGPSGLFYGINSNRIVSIDPGTGTVTVIATVNGMIATSLEYGEDGFLYALGQTLWKIDPMSGAVQVNGMLPTGWVPMGDLVYLDGIYYASSTTPQGNKLINVNLNNPAASTIITSLPAGGLVAGASVYDPVCPKLYWSQISTPNIHAYDVNSQTWSIACSSVNWGLGGGDTPNDYSFPYVCGCTINAGNVNPLQFNLCGEGATANTPYTGGAVLGSTGILRYVLVTDQNNPVGSMLFQNTSPVFGFVMGQMNYGQTYYIGTVAGQPQGGNVDLSDPCIDFSNQFARVVWQPQPSLVFTASNPNICAGACKDVQVALTGTPPFTLSYQVNGGTTQTQTFTSTNGLLQVCVPSGSSAQTLVLNALGLSDAYCSCQ